MYQRGLELEGARSYSWGKRVMDDLWEGWEGEGSNPFEEQWKKPLSRENLLQMMGFPNAIFPVNILQMSNFRRYFRVCRVSEVYIAQIWAKTFQVVTVGERWQDGRAASR